MIVNTFLIHIQAVEGDNNQEHVDDTSNSQQSDSSSASDNTPEDFLDTDTQSMNDVVGIDVDE